VNAGRLWWAAGVACRENRRAVHWVHRLGGSPLAPWAKYQISSSGRPGRAMAPQQIIAAGENPGSRNKPAELTPEVHEPIGLYVNRPRVEPGLQKSNGDRQQRVDLTTIEDHGLDCELPAADVASNLIDIAVGAASRVFHEADSLRDSAGSRTASAKKALPDEERLHEQWCRDTKDWERACDQRFHCRPTSGKRRDQQPRIDDEENQRHHAP
jgi:hypothetical protein